MYIIVALIIIVLPIVFDQTDLSMDTKNRLYLFVSGVILVLLTGLRSYTVGADTDNYLASFETVKDSDFIQLVMRIRTSMNIETRDPFYDVFVKVFQTVISADYRMYMFFIGIAFTVPLLIWIYRYSTDYRLSLLVYICMFFSFYGTTGYRQTLATAIIVLIGDKYIRNKKIVPFAILTVIAFLFHRSALVFFPFYFLSRIRITKRFILSVFVFEVIAFIFKNQLSDFFKYISGYGEMYTGQYEGAGTWTLTTALIAILFFTMLFKTQIMSNDEYSQMNINAVVLAIVFLPLTFVNPSALRVVMYFELYLVFHMKSLIYGFTEKSRPFAYAAICLLLILLCVKSGVNYSFMWQF